MGSSSLYRSVTKIRDDILSNEVMFVPVRVVFVRPVRGLSWVWRAWPVSVLYEYGRCADVPVWPVRALY